MIDYNAEGCYKDSKKKSKKIFTKKFSSVNGVNRRNPDVEKIFLECKEMAEKEGYEIFAIQVKVLIYTKELWMSIRGVSRGRVQGVRTPPPWDDLRFSNTTGILPKKTMWFIGAEVEQETSSPPPKKIPGSAPANRAWTSDWTKYL